MADEKPIIEPSRQGLWIAASFLVAVLGLGMSLLALHQIGITVAGTQGQVLLLNEKIEQLRDQIRSQPAPVLAPAPAAAPAPAPASTPGPN